MCSLVPRQGYRLESCHRAPEQVHGQSQVRGRVQWAGVFCLLGESVKYVWEKLGSDTLPIIFDLKVCLRIVCLCKDDIDQPLFWRELNGVREQVPDDLL